MKKFVITVACTFLTLASLSYAAENRFQQFQSDMDASYESYRIALFQTNKNDAMKSGKAVDSFQNQWKNIIATYSSQPPEIYSSDPKWNDTLAGIKKIAQESSALIKDGQLAEAHEQLEAIRDNLSSLRKRNSVIVFSDHINNYHQVMEGLFEEDFTPDKINESAINEIRGQLAVLKYLAEAIKDNSPPQYKDNEKYQTLQKELFTSLTQLEAAIESNKPETISKSIKMLKPAYAKLFVNFG